MTSRVSVCVSYALGWVGSCLRSPPCSIPPTTLVADTCFSASRAGMKTNCQHILDHYLNPRPAWPLSHSQAEKYSTRCDLPARGFFHPQTDEVRCVVELCISHTMLDPTWDRAPVLVHPDNWNLTRRFFDPRHGRLRVWKKHAVNTVCPNHACRHKAFLWRQSASETSVRLVG